MIAYFLMLVIVATYLVLSYYDYTQFRLPNSLIFLATMATGALLAAMGNPIHFFALILWPVLYLVMWHVGAKIGGGDVKLALSTGALASTAGVFGVLGAIALANVLSVCAMVSGRETVAHGPHMMIAAVAILATSLI